MTAAIAMKTPSGTALKSILSAIMRSRGCAFVEMTDNVEANRAIAALNGAESGGRPLIFSDEGFSVGIQDRSHIVYESHGKKMTIAGELGSNGFAAYLCNMKTWDDRTPVRRRNGSR